MIANKNVLLRFFSLELLKESLKYAGKLREFSFSNMLSPWRWLLVKLIPAQEEIFVFRKRPGCDRP